MRPRSLHERIRFDLESGILSGALPPGTRIPVEQELMAKYGCARMTVNKAISSLATAGLVERRKRAGSFVSRPRMHSMMLVLPDVQSQAIALGQQYAFHLLKRQIRAPRKRNLAEAKLAQNGPLLSVSGVHIVDHRPLAIEKRIVSLVSVPEIRHANLSRTSPGTWLLEHIPWTESDTHVSAVSASRAEASLLEVPANTACLAIERQTWRERTPITSVRQLFHGSAYSLDAHFGPSRNR